MKSFGININPFVTATVILAASLSLSSCNQDLTEQDVPQVSEGISFSPSLLSFEKTATKSWGEPMELDAEGMTVYLQEMEMDTLAIAPSVATKGTPATTMYESFYVTAYKSTTGSWTGSESPNFTNYQYKSYGNAWMRYGGTSPKWSASTDLWKFYAVGPNLVSFNSTAGVPNYTFSPSTTITSQTDLVEAVSSDYAGDYNDPVSLSFNHVLSGIQFGAGEFLTSLTVQRVTLGGIYTRGRHTIGTATWDVTTDNTTGSYALNSSVYTNGRNGDVFYDGANTFLIIPQVCPAGAYLEFQFQISGQGTFTTRADISGKEFKMGKTHLFKLSLDNSGWLYDFKMDMPTNWSYGGGNRTLKVYSSKYHTLGFYQPLRWTTEFSETGAEGPWTDTPPSWVTSFPSGGEGESNMNGTAYTLTASSASSLSFVDICSMQWPTSGSHTVYRGTAASPVDLSKEDVFGNANAGSLMTTANTYVVHSPGMYMIPLVYGNAITDGVTNVNSYSTTGLPSAGSSYCVDVFHNAYDTGISSPYIETDLAANSHTLGDALLVWGDLDGFIEVKSSLEEHNGIKYLVFEVPAETIDYGNAIVGVKDDSDNIVWSWQIWVTADELEDINTTFGSGITLLSKNIGQMPLTYHYNAYSPLVTFWVRFTQAETGAQIIKQFIRGSNETGKVSYIPSSIYQYGRKDPFPVHYTSSGAITVTYGDLPYSVSSSESTISSGTSIMHPNVFQKGSNNWCSDHTYFYNIWNMQANTNSIDCITIKTVYDPSPAGYCVPRLNTWDGMSISLSYMIDRTGDNNVNSTDFNTDYGWYFKRGPSDTEGYFMPITRYRNSAGVLYVDPKGDYWSATLESSSSGRLSEFTAGSFYPRTSCGRTYANAIRPQKIE